MHFSLSTPVHVKPDHYYIGTTKGEYFTKHISKENVRSNDTRTLTVTFAFEVHIWSHNYTAKLLVSFNKLN